MCWNFEPFVLALTDSYRDELKTHNRHVIGAHVGPKTLGKYKILKWFKKVLVVILGYVRNDVRNLIKALLKPSIGPILGNYNLPRWKTTNFEL